jgi:hypothetical protein
MKMKTACCFLLLASNLLARDITTLDGKSYTDCRVTQVYPDSVCVLFAGGGARIKLANLPEPVAREFGYDAARATAFEKAEAAQVQQQRAWWAAQVQQLQAQKRAAAAASSTQAPGVQPPASGGNGNNNGNNNNGSQYAAVNPTSSLSGAYNQSFGQGSGRGFGAQYVAVRMAWPGGGVRGIVESPNRTRP